MPKIVVSYRRADTGPIAGRIFDRLGTQYGFDSVFMDVDNIPFGVDFREHIQEELSQCDALVVIIGPRWMGTAEGGKTRLSDETDPVRIEVETAMRRRVPIIPILVDNATMPKPAELPDSLRDFAFRNAAEVDAAGRDFRQHMDRVIRSIDQIMARNASQSVTASAPRESSPAAEPVLTRQPAPAATPAANPQSTPAASLVPPAGGAGFVVNKHWAAGIGLAVLLAVVGMTLTITAFTGNKTDTVQPTAPSAPPKVATPSQPATDYPNKPVRAIVPFAAGGATDVVTRVVGDYLSQKLGQPFVIENRPGGGGTVGMQAVVSSPPDGYTLSVASTTDFLNRYLYKSLSYDPLRDLVPVAVIGRVPAVLVASPALPAKTLRELIAYAKANPGKVSYGTAGVGTLGHLGAAQFARAAGLDLVHVPFRGTAPAVAALLADQVNLMHAPLAVVQSQIQTGKLRVLAVVGQGPRRESLPDVPTTAEAGLPQYDFETWYGLVAPRGTPRPVIEKLNLPAREMVADPTVRKRITDMYLAPVFMSSDEFAAALNRDLPKLERLIKDLAIAVD